VERTFWKQWLAYLAELAGRRPVPDSDRELWRRFRDPNAADHPVDRDDFYGCEGQVLAFGRVPG
jgi:hypothetical protein